MNRVIVALLAVLLLLWVFRDRLSGKREPKCHYIYGCTNNLPDWSYWQSG